MLRELIWRGLRVAAITAVGAGMAATGAAAAGPPIDARITGDAGARGTPISDRLFGIFFEDINHAADGGLYPELVQNPSFEFSPVDNAAYTGLTAWALDPRGGAGTVAVAAEAPLNDHNLHYLRLTATARGALALRNTGFNDGVHVVAGERYRYSFFARRSGGAPLPVRVRVESAGGSAVFGVARTTVTAGHWKRYSGVLTATRSTSGGRVALVVDAPAALHADFDMVSLLPVRTWKGHGLRLDLARKIAALHPGFLRFPGGCVANVGSYAPFPERARVYRWKDTLGPLEQRPTNRNFWGYNQSLGIGFQEYFQFAEDLGAEPLPVVQVGVNGCGVNNRLTTPAQLAPFIQDTLDLIEFANGSTATKWGAVRAALGHPRPYHLKFLALGNEESDPQFLANYPQFADAVRARYPQIRLICNSGPIPNGVVFDRNWQMCRDQHADLVDEHYYVSQAFLLDNTHRYDSYDRAGPHVFLGEYAARAGTSHYNDFFSALSEAAYITGLERNSDVVEMASYAPLLANADYVNWSPDLIWFDNARAYGTPSYWVQRLFARNRGDRLVPSRVRFLRPDPPDPIRHVPGRFSNALELNGLTQYAQLPAGIVGGLHDFTISTWVKPAAIDTWARVFDFGSSTDVNMFLTLSEGSVPRFAITTNGGGNEDRLSGTAALPAGEWAHLAVTLSGTTGTLYVNGVAVATNPSMHLTPADLGATTNNWIGKSQYPADPLLHGLVDDFQIYSRALSAAEVQGLLTGPGAGDVASYGFEGAGDEPTLVSEPLGDPLYQVLMRDRRGVVLEVVNARPRALRARVDLGHRRLARRGTVTTLKAPLDAMNSFAQPTRVAPATARVSGLGRRFVHRFPADSVTVIRLSR
jgi:alpha-L-arabinofuranosidase